MLILKNKHRKNSFDVCPKTEIKVMENVFDRRLLKIGGYFMKKSLCIVLSALLVLFSFAACGKNDVEETETKVNANGEAYVVQKDDDGNEVTSVLSDKEKEKIDKKKENNKKNDSTTTTMSDTEQSKLASQVQNEMSGLTNFDQEDLVSDKKDLIPEGSQTSKTTLRKEVVLDAMKGDKLTLKMNLKGSGATTPVTLVINGNKIAADMTMNGSTVRVLIDSGVAYIIMPTLKMYLKMSDDEIGGLDEFKNLAGSADDNYVKTTKVTQDGVEYTCEEYKPDDSTVTKYYFTKDKQWKRMEVITGDEAVIYEIETFSNTADESMFSLKGYNDISALANLG